MAAGDITRGVRTALANVSRMDSCPVGEARTFGEVQLAGAVGLNIHLDIPINASASAGSYNVYITESQEGTEWTDGIDPTVDTGNVKAKLKDCKFIGAMETVYAVTNRERAEAHFAISGFDFADYVGIVLDNGSGQIVPSGSDGDSVTLKVSA